LASFEKDPLFYSVGTEGSLAGGKAARRVGDHSAPSSSEVKNA